MTRNQPISKRKSPEIPESATTLVRPSKKAKKAASTLLTSSQPSQDVSTKSTVHPAVSTSSVISNVSGTLSILQSTGYFIPLFMNCLILWRTKSTRSKRSTKWPYSYSYSFYPSLLHEYHYKYDYTCLHATSQSFRFWAASTWTEASICWGFGTNANH